MIERLSIHGLAIIDELSIEFSPGFNVITGETGAGKSILIRALTFLAGGKVSAEAVRKGRNQAVVSGEFWVNQRHPVLSKLESLGVPCEPEGDRYPVFVRRQLSQKGRTQAWVNDVGVTGAAIREVGRLLIDVFAQHENQRLIDPALHVSYLDEFVSVSELKQSVKEAFTKCFDHVEKIQSILERFRTGEQSRDFLEFRFEELKKFGPTESDYAEVATLCQSSKHRVRLKEIFQKAVQALESDGGLGARVWDAHGSLEGVGEVESELKKQIETLSKRLSTVATEIDDLTFELGQSLSRYDLDEDAIEKAESRLYGYQKLFRKHNLTEIKDLLALKNQLEADLMGAEQIAEKIEDEINDLTSAISELSKVSKKLTKARKQAATLIQNSVEKELSELSMKGAKFSAEFNELNRPLPALDFEGVEPRLSQKWEKVGEPLKGLSATGAEEIQFLLSANPGEPMLPLAKVASGGEISRIMLALKKSLTIDADTCVLVFDEIDTGISGRVADVVGKKMSELSQNFQVLCISHLPQVAVYADSHFLVKKAGKNNRTESTIIALSKEQSTEEIARLLSGDSLSDSSLKNAKTLMASAKKKKPKSRQARV